MTRTAEDLSIEQQWHILQFIKEHYRQDPKTGYWNWPNKHWDDPFLARKLSKEMGINLTTTQFRRIRHQVGKRRASPDEMIEQREALAAKEAEQVQLAAAPATGEAISSRFRRLEALVDALLARNTDLLGEIKQLKSQVVTLAKETTETSKALQDNVDVDAHNWKLENERHHKIEVAHNRVVERVNGLDSKVGKIAGFLGDQMDKKAEDLQARANGIEVVA